jgi:hypothetical protein
MPRVIASEEFVRHFTETFGREFEALSMEALASSAGLAFETPARLQGCAAIAEFYSDTASTGPTFLRIFRSNAWPDLPHLYDRLRLSGGISQMLDDADTERIEASENGYLTCALGLALASSYDVAVVTPQKKICLYGSHSEVLFPWPVEGEWAQDFMRFCNSIHLPKAMPVG